MLTRRRSALVVAAIAAGLLGGLAPPALAGTPYRLVVNAADRLRVTPITGGTTLAVSITQGASVTFSPAASNTVPLPLTCTTDGTLDVTVCPATRIAGELTVDADVVDVTVTNVKTARLALVGGPNADAMRVAAADPIGVLDLNPGGGPDLVRLDGPGLPAHTVDGSDGDDVLESLDSDVSIRGGAGNDVLTGPRELRGEGGNDLLRPRGVGGPALVNGGTGDDRVSFDGVAGPLRFTLGGGDATVTNAVPATTPLISVEAVQGSDGPDAFIRDPGPRKVVDGGDGEDTVSYENMPSGVDVDLVAGAGGSTDPALRDLLTSFERVMGSAGDDVVRGSAAPEVFSLLGGNDRADSGAGADVVDGGGGNDALNGGDGGDTLAGGPGLDTLRGESGSDVLDGGPEQDAVTYDERAGGQPVTVTLNGVADDGAPGENDTLVEIEQLVGGAGDDALTGDDNPNTILGGAGSDTLSGEGGADVVRAGAGRDVISGGGGSDELYGDEDDDRLLAFDNVIDVVSCGAGSDDEAEVDGLDKADDSCEFRRRLDVTGPSDRDGDGVVEGTDCDDRNATIFPGAVDVRGNGIDENCRGGDRPLQPVPARVTALIPLVRALGGVITSIRVEKLPAKSKIEIRCTPVTVNYRKRCPKTRTFTPKKRTFESTTVFYRKRIKNPLKQPYLLPPGSRVEVRVSAPGFLTYVKRYQIRRNRNSVTADLCLLAGAKSATDCPDDDDT